MLTLSIAATLASIVFSLIAQYPRDITAAWLGTAVLYFAWWMG